MNRNTLIGGGALLFNFLLSTPGAWADYEPPSVTKAPPKSAAKAPAATGTDRDLIAMNRADLLRADPRLARRVTITKPQIYTGELLETLSRQSGVALSTGARDGAGDEAIAVFARDTPLVDLMTGLWSLVSYRGATWRWLREGDGKNTAFAYRLTRPGPAQAFAANIQAEIQRAVEEDTEAMIAALQMSPEEMQKAAKQRPVLTVLSDPRVRRNIAGLAASVSTPEARIRVLRGTDKISLPAARWPDALREYVRAETELARSLNPNRSIPEPTYVHYDYEYLPGSITPSLSVLLGDENGGQGYTAVGGTPMRNRWGQILWDRWILDNDRRHDREREALTIPSPPKRAADKPVVPEEPVRNPGFELPPGIKPVRSKDTPKLLDAFNALTGIPVIARLRKGVYITPPEGLQISAFLRPFAQRMQQFKWRDGTLLISYPGHLQEKDEDKVPWSVLNRIRADLLADPRRLLPFPTVCYAAGQLSPAQLLRLDRLEGWGFFGTLVQHQEFYAPLHQVKPSLMRQLHAKEGVPLAALPEKFQERAAREVRDTSLLPGARVRIIVTNNGNGEEETETETDAQRRTFWLDFHSADGKRLFRRGIFWYGRYEPEKKAITVPEPERRPGPR